MAAQSAEAVQRCGACAQSFRLRPVRIPIAKHASGATHAACCPFCGFLNHPHPVPLRPTRTALKVVRPPEPQPAPALVSATPAAQTLAAAPAHIRPAKRPARPKTRRTFGTVLKPAAV